MKAKIKPPVFPKKTHNAHIPLNFPLSRETTIGDIFLNLIEYSVPSGTERDYYEKFLLGLGWERMRGGYIYNPGLALSFTAHLDIVCNEVKKLHLVDQNGIISASNGAIGADDRAGVSLILWLAHVKKLRATFLLFKEEEIGCVGSREFSLVAEQYLDAFNLVISLDRKGYCDIITHQMSERCCSTEVARALQKELRRNGLVYKPSSEGLYTDSYYLFRDTQGLGDKRLIDNAINLSVGYFDAHTDHDYQDLPFLIKLGHGLAGLNYESLLEQSYSFPCPIEPPKKAKSYLLWDDTYREVQEENEELTLENNIFDDMGEDEIDRWLADHAPYLKK